MAIRTDRTARKLRDGRVVVLLPPRPTELAYDEPTAVPQNDDLSPMPREADQGGRARQEALLGIATLQLKVKVFVALLGRLLYVMLCWLVSQDSTQKDSVEKGGTAEHRSSWADVVSS